MMIGKELKILFKIDILELPIRWKHQEGSKVNVFIDSIKFFIRLPSL